MLTVALHQNLEVPFGNNIHERGLLIAPVPLDEDEHQVVLKLVLNLLAHSSSEPAEGNKVG